MTPPSRNLSREVPCVPQSPNSKNRLPKNAWPCRAAKYLGITQLTPHELDRWDIQSTLCISLSSSKLQTLHKKPKQWHHQYMIAVSPPTKMNDEEECSVLFRPRLCITKTSVPPGHVCLPPLRNRRSTSTCCPLSYSSFHSKSTLVHTETSHHCPDDLARSSAFTTKTRAMIFHVCSAWRKEASTHTLHIIPTIHIQNIKRIRSAPSCFLSRSGLGLKTYSEVPYVRCLN
jgi:hypothetical protein